MKNITKISLLLVFALSLVIIGCKKAQEPVAPVEEAIVEEDTLAMPEVTEESESTDTLTTEETAVEEVAI